MHLTLHNDTRLLLLSFALTFLAVAFASDQSSTRNNLTSHLNNSHEIVPTLHESDHISLKHDPLRRNRHAYSVCPVTNPNTSAQEAGEPEVRGSKGAVSLHKRAPRSLVSDTPVNDNIVGGSSLYFVFSGTIEARDVRHFRKAASSEVAEDSEDQGGFGNGAALDIAELRKRQPPLPSSPQSARTVYITMNTCQQPDVTSASAQGPPQLTLYVSTSSAFSEPGRGSPSPPVITAELDEGYAAITVNTTNDVFIGIAGPQDVTGGTWNFELAASLQAPYHLYDNTTGDMYMIDSDPNHALLITKNLTSLVPTNTTEDQWTQNGPPLNVFIQNVNNTAQRGISHSYCGLRQLATQSGVGTNPDSIATTTSISHYLGPEYEQQFYVSNLNASSVYNGYLVLPPNASSPMAPGGGGTVYASMNFTTKRFANCAVIYDLAFCSAVAYAVPANPARFPDMASLASLYDNTTARLYDNFHKSLQQIPCNTTASAQYSLIKTCDDCAAAYKAWLCAVSIPRCADWAPDPNALGTPWLQPRNAAQAPIQATPDIAPVTNTTLLSWLATSSSRNNATIAGSIAPGPYSEIMPCQDLCYELVRSCPASLGFACPMGSSGRSGLNRSYGLPDQAGPGGLSCSGPGSVYGANAGVGLRVGVWVLWIGLALAVGFAQW